MNRVLCFGEVLLRFSPVLNGEWLQTNSLPVFVGGAELNVATALANWGVATGYFSAMPDNFLADEIEHYIQTKHIDTSAMHRSGNRIGSYYLPQGADMKNAGVVYDRAHSSFAELKTGIINWNEVLEGVDWFHFSAITPALSPLAVALCKEALQAASDRKITISVDLNHRARLWQYGRQPAEVMPALVKYCDVIMGNLWAANTLLGLHIPDNVHANKTKPAYLHHAKNMSEQICEAYPKCTYVANTFRFDENDKGIRYFSSLYYQQQMFELAEYYATEIVDKVGSGDCFMAGLIYGCQQQFVPQQIIDFAASAAFGKFFEKGDITHQPIQVINKRLK